MVQFLHDNRILRKTCTVILCCAGAIILLGGMVTAVSELFNHGRMPIEVYNAFKKGIILNVIGGVLLGVGLLISSDDSAHKINMIAATGVCGMLSFMFYGFFAVLFGFVAGKIVAPLGIIIFTVYACTTMLIGTRTINSYIWERLNEKTASKKRQSENQTGLVV